MLSMGISLGFLSVAGFYLIWKKIPGKVRDFAYKHALFTDAVLFVGTYWILGGTLTALIAAACAGIFISAFLEVQSHPEKYLWIHAGMDSLKQKTSGFRLWLEDINNRYREKMEKERLTSHNEEIIDTVAA